MWNGGSGSDGDECDVSGDRELGGDCGGGCAVSSNDNCAL